MGGPVMSNDARMAVAPNAPAAFETAEARLRRMVRTHVDALWRFMRRLGVYESDLDDAMQEVVFATAGRLGDIPPASERAFLYGTAFRVGSEWRRRRGSRHEVSDDALSLHETQLPAPDALTDQARARKLLDDMLADMPTDLRAVFTLYEVEEMTMAEIAQILDLPPGTVASRLRRAREHFERSVERLQARTAPRARAGSVEAGS